MADTRNSKVLADFVQYCVANPDMRFWQALRAWAEASHIFIGELDPNTFKPTNLRDTYYREGKDV